MTSDRFILAISVLIAFDLVALIMSVKQMPVEPGGAEIAHHGPVAS